MCFISHSPQLCIIYEPAEGALCPVVQVIKEDNERYCSQYQPLEYTISAWVPVGFTLLITTL